MPAQARRIAKPIKRSDRIMRNLRALEHSASTSRVLNLVAIEAQSMHRPEYHQQPLFMNKFLNTALVIKHRLRPDDVYLFNDPLPIATKIIIPFDRRDLSLGGRAVFVGQRGWTNLLAEACAPTGDLGRDIELLRLIDILPSLDPFIMREQLRRHDIIVASSYFALSPADFEAMQTFVSREIARPIKQAFSGSNEISQVHFASLVQALLAADVDDRLDPLRQALLMEGDSFKEGVFSWKGFLYYKWTLNRLWPQLGVICNEIGRLSTAGRLDQKSARYLNYVRRRLQAGIPFEREGIQRTLRVYDEAFADLVENRRPQAFRDFLLRSPEMFLDLGERVGLISHIASFWRYRFPPGTPLSCTAKEAVEILMDFEASLSKSVSL